jgi:hypothetical protein
MSNRQARQLPFVQRVETALTERFSKPPYNHRPSASVMDGLCAIATTIELMAQGKAERKTYLSCSPVGSGKTETVIEALVQLMKDEQYCDQGIIVFIAQLDELAAFAKRLRANGIAKSDLAIEVGIASANDELRQLGRGRFNKDGRWISEHSEARIVIATQAKLLALKRKGYVHDYEKKNLWNYRGKPRSVRIWDEAILPADPVVVTKADLKALQKQLVSWGYDAAAKCLADWQATLSTKTGVTEVPMFGWRIPIDEDAELIEERFPAGSAGRRLYEMMGNEMHVREDYDGNTVLHYTELLPKHFAPLLVLDASGDLRLMYEAWAKGRGDIKLLPHGKKYYDGLTIHHWDQPSGRVVYRTNEERNALADAAASILSRIPKKDKVLFIIRKPEPGKPFQDVRAHIRKKVKELGFDPFKRIRFVTWGLHSATNKFSDCKHVVLLGVLQTRHAVTEATLRAAGQLSADTELDEREVRKAHLGEIAHNVFQAIGRGHVRRMEGDQCPKGCTVWAIFFTGGTMGIPRPLLSKCFPGATVKTWRPVAKLRDARNKTDAREAFVRALMLLLGERAEVTFDRSVFRGEFDDVMVHRFLQPDDVVRLHLKLNCGITLEDGPLIKRGRTRAATYRLRRGIWAEAAE